MTDRVPEHLRCSFCRKDQNDVRKLIAGPAVFICDECVAVCVDIIADDSKFTGGIGSKPSGEQQAAPQGAGLAVRCSLCKMPMVIEDALPVLNRGVLCPGCLGEIQNCHCRTDIGRGSPAVSAPKPASPVVATAALTRENSGPRSFDASLLSEPLARE